MPKEKIIERAEKLLKLLGLFEARNRIAGGYSGGMKRQLSLIISLINDPAILFLDEPTVDWTLETVEKYGIFFNQRRTKRPLSF
jgi:ABC-type multidrug transport system ATPase subunit